MTNRIFRWGRAAVAGLLIIALGACGEGPWNNPHSAAEERGNVLFSSFSERPKHLDPARSYSSNEYAFIGQIYEPPLQYHYLKRPYELIPLSAASLPEARYYDAADQPLPADAAAEAVAYTVYEVHIRPGMHYQPHPALAVNAAGEGVYFKLSREQVAAANTLADFPEHGSREVTAADFVHQIKRLVHPKLHSPIVGLMSEYITGMQAYQASVQKAYEDAVARDGKNAFIDLSRYPLEGVEVVDDYTYRIKIRGVYPQFVYWLSMPFFSPMPPEADRFYGQPGMAEKNLTLDWYPLGSGPYMLTVNNPNREMVLEKNPRFHGELYPSEGEEQDAKNGLLADAGKALPLIDKAVYSLEKESIPYWNKFLQGYYDASGVSSDSFDQAVRVGAQGEASLTDDMRKKGIALKTTVAASTFYMGFNMLDSVVGGLNERARKLRQAVSIAIDYEEYISIFANGRGLPAQGPLPPGIFGNVSGRAGINPYVYDWVGDAARRKSIDTARRLLAEAGYPNGADAQTGAPLLLNLDITAGGPDDKARLNWFRKQLQKINVELNIRNTDYNRFQDKMLKGNAQIFMWGWNADYPDPENFLFLLYGPNAKAKSQGENAANYDNPAFNRLFNRMKNMPNGPARQAVIDEMVEIARYDAPWIWGFNPKDFRLYHAWYKNAQPNLMANNTLKYLRIDPVLRAEKQNEWNQPVLWPLGLVAGVLLLSVLPALALYRRRLHTPVKKRAAAAASGA